MKITLKMFYTFEYQSDGTIFRTYQDMGGDVKLIDCFMEHMLRYGVIHQMMI